MGAVRAELDMKAREGVYQVRQECLSDRPNGDAVTVTMGNDSRNDHWCGDWAMGRSWWIRAEFHENRAEAVVGGGDCFVRLNAASACEEGDQKGPWLAVAICGQPSNRRRAEL